METSPQQESGDYYYLPDNSTVPSASVAPHLLSLIGAANSAIRRCQEYLRQPIFPNKEKIWQELGIASKELHSASLLIKGHVSTVPSEAIRDTGEKEYDIYDRYFKVVRVKAMPSSLFLNSVLTIVAEALDDILESPLALSEITAVVEGIATIFDLVVGQNRIGHSSTPAIKSKAGPIKASYTAEEAAKKRWIIHHLLYDVVLMYSGSEIANAIEAIKNDRMEEAVGCIGRAVGLFRASTACMWAASTFSSKVYLTYIRPSMITTEAPNGFSGDMNREFAYWKAQKRTFRELLEGMPAIPVALMSAVNTFIEIYMEDGEHHILIAATAVGNLTSLSQCSTEQKYGVKYQYGAVSVLRDILEMRKNEWEFIKQKPLI